MRQKAKLNSTVAWVFMSLALLTSSPVAAQSASEHAAALWFEKDYKGAVSIWQDEAESGDSIAQYNLGWAFEEGLGVIQNLQQSVHWYQRAADQGDLNAKVKLVEIWSRSDFESVNFRELDTVSEEVVAELHKSSETKEFLEHQALHGEAFANYLLASALLSNDSTENYVDEIVERLTSAASENHVLAQYALGNWLSESTAGELAVEEALGWFRKAAENGYPRAQFELAALYEIGGYHGQDAREALRWYREAEKYGEVRARLRIGRLLRAAAISADDFNKAREWFVKADSAGDNLAKFYIGEMYFLGEGQSEDPSIGFAWTKRMIALEPQLFSNLEEFALGGSLFAQLTIAKAHATEDSGFYEPAKAFDWFLTAALQGNVLAAREVGDFYVTGLGVEQDLAEGQMWLERAAEAGDVPASMLLRELEVEKQRREAAEKVAQEKAAKEAEIAEKERKAAEEESAGDREREECVPTADDEKLEIVGQGSGFIINPDGYLVTNFHVVTEGDDEDWEYCDAVSVTDYDQNHRWAKWIGDDPKQDLAVLKTCAPSRSFAFLRDGSRLLQAGEAVYAYGFPVAASSLAKITDGIISTLVGPGDDSSYLQHTAPITFGNSGGPLLDKFGLVVGVNQGGHAVVSDEGEATGFAPGVGYAVKGSITQAFLAAHSIEFKVKQRAQSIEVSEIATRSNKFTIQVFCWAESE